MTMPQAVTVTIANWTGQIDRHPDHCPICHSKIVPTPMVATAGTPVFEADLEIAYICPNSQCKEMFIAYFDEPEPDDYSYRYRTVRPVKPIDQTFSKPIKTVSPSFCEIYDEASAVEKYGLKQVCGVAYRKSIEFLIKDYLIAKRPNDAEAIKRALLGTCIENYVTDQKIKQVAKRAVWLGNDETHYERRWVDKDLTDLKRLIQLVVHWIDAEFLTEEAISSMPN
jgi:hypothetical protein